MLRFALTTDISLMGMPSTHEQGCLRYRPVGPVEIDDRLKFDKFARERAAESESRAPALNPHPECRRWRI